MMPGWPAATVPAPGWAVEVAWVRRAGELIADRARSRILVALTPGRELSASLLAGEAGVSRPTASAHLKKLTEGGLIAVRAEGKNRHYRLAGPAVADVLERLMELAPPEPITSLRASTRAAQLRRARSCYDHLAGSGSHPTARPASRRPSGSYSKRGEHEPLPVRCQLENSDPSGCRPATALPAQPWALTKAQAYRTAAIPSVGCALGVLICRAFPADRRASSFADRTRAFLAAVVAGLFAAAEVAWPRPSFLDRRHGHLGGRYRVIRMHGGLDVTYWVHR